MEAAVTWGKTEQVSRISGRLGRETGERGCPAPCHFLAGWKTGLRFMRGGQADLSEPWPEAPAPTQALDRLLPSVLLACCMGRCGVPRHVPFRQPPLP